MSDEHQKVGLEYEDSTDNLYEVPAKAWRQWTTHQRRVFNAVYSEMLTQPEHFQHPDATPAFFDHWTTTAWNAGWVAAHHAGDC